jgi:RNA-directed DNA polymerase
VDYRLYYLVRNWLKREHGTKSLAWISKRYRRHDLGRWDFAAVYSTASDDRRVVRLFRAAYLPIHYHIKIRSEANPYDPRFEEYFANRNFKGKLRAMSDRVHLNRDSYHKATA